MNERDSEAVAAMLRARGYRIVGAEADCDILLLNTCSVRDAAEQKAIGKAGYAGREERRALTSSWAYWAAWPRTAERSFSTGSRMSTSSSARRNSTACPIISTTSGRRARRACRSATPSSISTRRRFRRTRSAIMSFRRTTRPADQRLRLDPAGLQHGLRLLHRAEDPRRRALQADRRHRGRVPRTGRPRRVEGESRCSARS